MQTDRKDGDLLMDAPEHSSIAELIEKAKDRDGWRKLVNDLKPPKRKRRQGTGNNNEYTRTPQSAIRGFSARSTAGYTVCSERIRNGETR
eukprot:COSAG04_NODE_1070_length_8477_cov_17.005729_4_plen_90_part_00